MITLREFLKMIRDEQYRIYQPNRDCLIFESYFTVHSPYFFDEEHEKSGEWFNTKYYDDNDYCPDIADLVPYDGIRPYDVRKVVKPVLVHRLVLSSEARIQREDSADVLEQILMNIKVPM